MKIACFILGTRPETIKLYPLIKIFKKKFKLYVIHTGQHYDYNMQGQFFKDLNVKPDTYLNLNTNNSTRKIFISSLVKKLTRIYLSLNPDYIINQGDTDSVRSSVLAFNKVKKKINSKLVHIEAGIRSFDKKMPEENNRILADRYSDFLFAPTKIAKKNLINEKVSKNKIYVFGNTISDSIKLFFKKKKITKNFFFLTLHRVETVNIKKRLLNTLCTLIDLTKKLKVKIVFPVHPRTMKIMEKYKIRDINKINLIKPCSYKKSL